MNDLKARSVPPHYKKAHLQLAKAINRHWLTLNALREFMDSDDANYKKANLKMGRDSWHEGRRLRSAAKQKYGHV